MCHIALQLEVDSVVMVMEEKENPNTLGEFLKTYRTKEKEMSLRDFADLIDISFSHLSKIERGEHIPSKTTLSMIAIALNIDKDKLFLMAGYAGSDYTAAMDMLFPKLNEDAEETNRKASII